MRNSYVNVVTNTPLQQVQQDVVEEIGVETTDSTFNSNLHPLYLQNMDHPGLVLIAKKLTGSENFGPWKRSLSIDLSAKNNLGLVDGSIPRPDEFSVLRSQWDIVNDMVINGF